MAAFDLHSTRAQAGSESATPASDSPGPGVLDRVRQVFCGLHGHDELLQFSKARMYLKCVSCGHESPGWTMDDMAAPVRRAEGRPRAVVRPEAVRPELARERQVA
jgi:hypothetical protein